MSYARFGRDSDVYVYRGPDGRYWCCGCPRLDDVHSFESAELMIAHLELDRAAGYAVPQEALQRLQAEA